MESNSRGIHRQPASTYIPPQSSGRILFMEQAHPPGGLGYELERRHHGHVQDYHQLPQPQPQPQPGPHSLPFASTQSYDIQEAIQREIEKSRIREQLIMQELLKRRMLESEVRRELMMERELALSQGGNGLSFDLPSMMGFNSSVRLPTMGSVAEGRFQGERSIFPHSERMNLNGRCECEWYNDLPFQRAATNLRVSEVKSVLEAGKEKEKIILLAKPDETSGSKRKAGTPLPGANASEIPSDDISRKRAKEEWSCALCQVSATSERGLNAHLEGRKHKAKEAKLKAKAMGKNHSLGMLLKKHVKSIQVQGSLGPVTVDGPNVSLLPQKAREEDNQALLPKRFGSESLTKNHVTVSPSMQKSDDLKKKFKFWCDMCQVGANSEKVMDSHKYGKKHLARLQKWNKKDAAGAGQSNQSEQIVNDKGDADNYKTVALGRVGEEAFNESGSVDHVPTDTVEPQGNETVNETKTEDCAAKDTAESNDGVSTKPDASNEEPTVC